MFKPCSKQQILEEAARIWPTGYWRAQCKHRSAFPVKSLCRELDISRSLYYAVKKAQPSLRSQEDLALRAEIVKLNAAHRWVPGAVKMWRLLSARGIKCSQHHVRRLRKMENIQTSRIKRFRAIQAMQRV